MCVCVDKSEAKLKQLSFTEEVNTSGNLHWMLGVWGFHAGTSITAHVQHLFTSLRQTFTPPAACPVGRLWGDKEALVSPRLTPSPSVFEYSDVLENSLLLFAFCVLICDRSITQQMACCPPRKGRLPP